MSINATINADMFRRCAIAVSTEETRFYLQGVYVHAAPKKGVFLVASDSNVLLKFYDPEGSCEGSAIVKLPAAMLKLCTPPRRGESEPLIITTDAAGVVSAEICGQVAKNCAIDGSFPDYKYALPVHNSTMSVHGAFDTKLLSRVGQALSTDAKTAPLTLRGENAQSPHLAFGAYENGFGVVMPLRHVPSVPAWL